MGYNTNMYITIEHVVKDRRDITVDTFCDQLVNDQDISGNFRYLVKTGMWEEMRWYMDEMIEDMRVISLKYPDWLFTIDGDGEDDDDLWRAYFMNGKMAWHNAPTWTPPPFAEADLREIEEVST